MIDKSVGDILEIVDEISPFDLQDSWDNSGLIVGKKDKLFSNIYLSLDLDTELIDSVEDGSLFIVHHPLIFGELKSLDFDTYPAKLIQKIIKKDISVIAMHTNFDKTHLNRYVLEEILGYKVSEIDGYLAYFDLGKEFDEFVNEVAKKLSLDSFRVVKGSNFIKSAALCTGSGASLLSSLRADLLLTGDLKYHEALSAKIEKKSVIDIGHFESEIYFAKCLKKALQTKGINGIIKNSKNPFNIIVSKDSIR